MAQKPVVVYIEEKHGHMNLGNFEQEALAAVLRIDHKCEVLTYGGFWQFKESLARLKKYSRLNLLILVIVKQEKYSSKQHEETIAFTRKLLGSGLPVVVIPGGDYDGRFKGVESDDQVFALDHTDMKFTELIERLVSEWKPPVDWLGSGTKSDQALLQRQLRRAHRVNNPDDERMLAAGDHNHRTVAEALRIHMLPTTCLKSEFDDTLKRDYRRFDPVVSSVYEREVKKIRNMSDEESTHFDHSLMRARGHEPRDGGVYVASVSCGADVKGFAIDPVTLETKITYGFGKHHMVKKLLSYRVFKIEAWRSRKHWMDYENEHNEHEIGWRLLSGLIFTKIPGFTTPIVQLWTNQASDKQISMAIDYIHGQRKFIPVNACGKLYEPSA